MEGLKGNVGRAAFSETWLPGHPFFGQAVSPLRSPESNHLYRETRAVYLESAVEIPSPKQTVFVRRPETPASMS